MAGVLQFSSIPNELRERRGTLKIVLRERQLNSMLRREQAAMAFPALNPKHLFIYSGMVYRIRPQGLQILSPTFFQHFKEVRNTAWFITVPSMEHTCMMRGWIQRGVVASLIPFEKDYAKLTWRPQYYNGEVPPVNSETRRGANFPNVTQAMYLGGHIMGSR